MYIYTLSTFLVFDYSETKKDKNLRLNHNMKKRKITLK